MRHGMHALAASSSAFQAPVGATQGGRDVGVSGPLAKEDVVGDALPLAVSVSLC